MNKTPEELAEEYTKDWWGNLPEAEGMRKSARENYLAGYKAAQEHAHAALEEAEVKIDRLQTNTQSWISVKDKLPEDHRHYIVVSNAEIVDAPVWYNGCQSWKMELAYYSQRYERWMTGVPTLKDVPEDKITFEVTHWQELPEPPKEEG